MSAPRSRSPRRKRRWSMPDRTAERPAVYTIPSHRSFADSLAAGLMRRFGGDDPLALAQGRILLPNNRAVRTVTDAFVRLSGAGLLLPRLIPIGDPELDDRLGGALDPLGADEPPPAIDPLERHWRWPGWSARMGSAGPRRCGSRPTSRGRSTRWRSRRCRRRRSPRRQRMHPNSPPIGRCRSTGCGQLSSFGPGNSRRLGAIDLTERRNLLLRRIAERWKNEPPTFTVAAGITTAAPAVAALLSRVARMDGGMVVLPGLSTEAAARGGMGGARAG